MEIEFIALVGAFGGGAFAAAIGGLTAFIFTGFAVLVGVAAALAGAEYDVLGNIAFGPVFGPHISFAGGVAAVSYAARKGQIESARDIAAPVVGFGGVDALAVGGIFGVGGYLVNRFLQDVIDGATLTDTVALTVTISAIVVRLMFGRSGLFGSYTPDPTGDGRGRMSVSSDAVWVGHQAAWGMTAMIGLVAGLIASFATVSIAGTDPELANATRTFLFGVSAVSLILLQFGQLGPVTHHMTLPAAVAAGTMMVAGADENVAFLVGAATGVAGGLVGELAARVFLIHGDTHVDPPAIAIFIMTSFVLLMDALI